MMTEEQLKKIDAIYAEIGVIKQFIMSRDIVTNQAYCDLKGIGKRGLLEWFKKGCPREDNRHVSISTVDNWVKERELNKRNNA